MIFEMDHYCILLEKLVTIHFISFPRRAKLSVSMFHLRIVALVSSCAFAV